MMEFFSDSHVHSLFSEDGKQEMEDIVKKAIEKGMRYITFTEHVDYNPNDDGYMFFNYEDYTSRLNSLKDKYKKSITILKGIEFGEPHLYPLLFHQETKRDYDMIMASIHWHDDVFYGDRRMMTERSADEVLRIYYEDTLRMIEFGGFDVLAHLDFPKRYFKFENTAYDLVDEILTALIRKRIVLEINTSGFRKDYLNSMPDDYVIGRYHELGGEMVSLGSDAHHGDDLQNGFDRIRHHEADSSFVFIRRKLTKI